MRLLKACFKNYKVLDGRCLEFGENPFFFSAPNETGKSSLIEGIRDAFLLSPDRLKEKRTKGKDADPVVEVTFEIEGGVYELRVNAQDRTVRLVGTDGTDLSRPKAIERFLERKGYRYFPSVLEGLLILKERDLSTDTSRGLKALLDSVLKSARIEEVKRFLEDMLIVQKGAPYRFKSRVFGGQERLLKEELNEVRRRLKEVLRVREEFLENKRRLQEVKRKLEELLKRRSSLERDLQKEKRLLAYATFKRLEERTKALKEAEERLKAQLERYEADEKELAFHKQELKRRLERLFKELEELNEKKSDFKVVRREFEEYSSKLKVLERLEEVEKRLGRFCSESLGGLEADLREWKTYQGIFGESRGVFEVLEAEGAVEVVGRGWVRPGELYEFEGEVTLRYKDLVLKVYASEELKRIKGRLDELKERYGTLENLEELLRLVATREELLRRIGRNVSPEAIRERLRHLSEELEAERKLEEELERNRRERELLNRRELELEQKLEALRRKKRSTELELARIRDEIKRCEDELKRLFKEVETLTIGEEREFREVALQLDIEEFGRRVEEREAVLEELKERIFELEKEKSLYEGLTSKELDEGELESLLLRRRELEEKLSRMLRLSEVLRYGLRVLSELRQEISRNYLAKFEESVSELFSRITHGNYTGVRFEAESLFFDGSTFRKQWRAVRRDQRSFPIEELSDGTSSQLLLAARLALVRLFFDRKAFLLFDEPFAYFDEYRTKKAVEVLYELAEEGWQVIVTSAKGIPK